MQMMTEGKSSGKERPGVAGQINPRLEYTQV